MTKIQAGKIVAARWEPSPHFDARPYPGQIDLIVIHCISLPEGQYHTGAPLRLFGGTLDTDEHPSFADLQGVHVSPHLFIARDGETTQCVELHNRAWHAGKSSYQARDNCNHFSVGIELEGCVTEAFEERQYKALELMLALLLQHYPAIGPQQVVGHMEVAPERKNDPGPKFDWPRITRFLHQVPLSTA